MPGEGVEVGGDDAEAAMGVGVGAEEHESARESIGFVVGFLRLGLAEDGGQPHLIVIAAGRNEGEKALLTYYVTCL